jgi:hypothetical protein
MILPLKVRKALLLILASRLSRFLRLVLEKPLTLSLIPPPQRTGGLRRFLVMVSSKERVDTDPPTAEVAGNILTDLSLERKLSRKLDFRFAEF